MINIHIDLALWGFIHHIRWYDLELMKALERIAFILFFLVGIANQAHATSPFKARIERFTDRSLRISGLRIKTKNVTLETEVRSTHAGQEFTAYAILEGTYKKSWDLFRKKQRLLKAGRESKVYKVSIPLGGERTVIRLIAVGPDGQVEREKIVIFLEDYKLADHEARRRPKQLSSVMTSVGITSIRYQETGLPDFRMLALTAKISYRKVISPPNWDLGTNLFFNAVPLWDTDQNVTVRYIGLNFRIGYVVPSIYEPWRLSILGGWYYTAMLVTNNLFGFKNLNGPQLFPLLRKGIGGRKSIYIYAKFSPLSSGFKILALSNREVAVGLGMIIRIRKVRSMIVSLDYNNIRYTENDISTVSDSASLSLGYGW